MVQHGHWRPWALYTKECYSHWRPRNPLIVYNVSMASVLLVDGLKFAAPQYDPAACLWWSGFLTAGKDYITKLCCRAPSWQSAAATSVQTRGISLIVLLASCFISPFLSSSQKNKLSKKNYFFGKYRSYFAAANVIMILFKKKPTFLCSNCPPPVVWQCSKRLLRTVLCESMLTLEV